MTSEELKQDLEQLYNDRAFTGEKGIFGTMYRTMHRGDADAALNELIQRAWEITTGKTGVWDESDDCIFGTEYTASETISDIEWHRYRITRTEVKGTVVVESTALVWVPSAGDEVLDEHCRKYVTADDLALLGVE